MKTRILYRTGPDSQWQSFGIFPAATAAKVAANLRNQRGNLETDLQPENTPVQPQQPKDTNREAYTGTLF